MMDCAFPCDLCKASDIFKSAFRSMDFNVGNYALGGDNL